MTTPKTPDGQNVQRKSSWRDANLKWICGFANAQGGILEIGRNDCGEVVGVGDVHRLRREDPQRGAVAPRHPRRGEREVGLRTGVLADRGQAPIQTDQLPGEVPLPHRKHEAGAGRSRRDPSAGTRKPPENHQKTTRRSRLRPEPGGPDRHIPAGESVGWPSQDRGVIGGHDRGKRQISAGQAQESGEVTSHRARQGRKLDGRGRSGCRR